MIDDYGDVQRLLCAAAIARSNILHVLHVVNTLGDGGADQR
jgi:hypothetical protein